MFNILSSVNILSIFGFFTGIGHAINQALRSLFGFLAALIYDFIVIEYDLFVTISRAEILDNAFVEQIYEKVGMILGIFMLFKLTFSLIQHLIEPSKFTDQSTGFVSLIKRFVISIVLLGTVPSIFRMAFDVQNFIVGSNDSNNNVIYKLIIGDSISTNVKDFGSKLASDLFFIFYKEADGYKLESEAGVQYDENAVPHVQDFDYLVKEIEGGKSFRMATQYLTFTRDNVYIIDYNGLFSIAVGIIVAYMLILYIVQVSIRVVQLAYLQVIAPIPILSYISDPKGSFNKWIKQCVSTYLDLFIRVAVLYFIVYLCNTIMVSFDNPSSALSMSIGNASPGLRDWIEIFIVVGLLLFGKKVPELIKDLFPNLGTSAGKFDLGLKSPKKAWSEYAAGLPVLGKPIGWLGNKISTPAKKLAALPGKGAKWAGKKMTAPITNSWNTMKENHKTRVEGKKEFRKNNKKYNEGLDLHREYKDDIGGAFRGEYADSYRAVGKAKKLVGEKGTALEVASVKLKNAIASGVGIEQARADYEKASKEHSSAQKQLEFAKARHDVNKKRYTKYAEMEDNYNYYSDVEKLSKMSTNTVVNTSNNRNANVNSSVNNGTNATRANNNGSNTTESGDSVYKRVNEITGVSRESASKHGAPTEENSLLAQLAENARQHELQEDFLRRFGNENDENTNISGEERADNTVYERVNDVTGVNRENSSEHGAPTEENSLMAQLAEQARQMEMQEEFLRRLGKENADMSDEQQDDNAVYERVNDVTGVNRENASEHGAPTEDNSLMAQLAEQARQMEMQEEFLKRLGKQNNDQQDE